jgi:hypothetical protein
LGKIKMNAEIFQTSCGDKYVIENGEKVWLDEDLRPVYPCTRREKEIIRESKAREAIANLQGAEP